MTDHYASEAAEMWRYGIENVPELSLEPVESTRVSVEMLDQDVVQMRCWTRK